MTQEIDAPEGANVDPRETKRVVEETVTTAAPVEQVVERTEEVRTETTSPAHSPNPANG